MPNPTAMQIIQKRISLETIIRLERNVLGPYKFFLIKAGVLLQIISTTTNLLDQYFPVRKRAESDNDANYPKTYFTRNDNYA